METTTRFVTAVFIFSAMFAQGFASGKLYLALLSYSDVSDVSKTCCDIVSGPGGLCVTETATCDIGFRLSVSPGQNKRSNLTQTAFLSAPIEWSEGTLNPRVYTFEDWASTEITLGIEMVTTNEEPGQPTSLVDSASSALTITKPSDMYTSFLFTTVNGAVVHVMYRFACESGHTSFSCSDKCETVSELCDDEIQAEEDETNVVEKQALKYFGSPLARCPISVNKDTTTSTTTSTGTTTVYPTPSKGSDHNSSIKPSSTTPPSALSSTADATISSSMTTDVSATISTFQTIQTTETLMKPSTADQETISPSSTSTPPESVTTSSIETSSSNVPTLPATLPVVAYTTSTSTRSTYETRSTKSTVSPSNIPETTAKLVQNDDNDDPMRFWGAIVGGIIGGLVLIAVIGYIAYRSRQRTLQKRQEIYTVTPQNISSIEENGTSGRSDVPMTTALL